MSKSPCLEPGCAALVPGGRCTKHARRFIQRYRDPQRNAVYSSRRWKGTRRAVMLRDRWCTIEGCTNPSYAADHIISLKETLAKGNDPFDMDNLRGLCAFHHGQHTAQEVWARKREIDGVTL